MSDPETLFVFMAYTWAIVKLGDMIRKFQRRIRNEVKTEFHR